MQFFLKSKPVIQKITKLPWNPAISRGMRDRQLQLTCDLIGQFSKLSILREGKIVNILCCVVSSIIYNHKDDVEFSSPHSIL